MQRNQIYQSPFLFILFVLLSSNSIPLYASTLTSDCAFIADNKQRLACYDQADNPNSSLVGQGSEFSFTEDTAADYLNRTWELSKRFKAGTFRFRPYNPNAVLLWRNSNNPNTAPFTPTQTAPVNTTIQSNELRYQLSFKTKLWQNVLGSSLDLWFGYTQQSNWQIYNQDTSSPFRETNYEPELILTIPMHTKILGFNWKLLNIGLSHQSNGRSNPYSRSWNRTYLKASFEHKKFLLAISAWQRLSELPINDDNPDINMFMGSGDIRLTWVGQDNKLSILGRYSFGGDNGALQLSWVFPLRGHLKGYAEYFSGYGESLIDYNHNQKIFGLGLLISTWP